MREKLKYYYMNTAELLDSVIDIYKKSFGQQIALSIIFNIILTAVLFVIIFLGILVAMVSLIGSFDINSFNTANAIILAAAFISILFLVTYLYQAIYGTGNIILAMYAYLGQKAPLGNVIKTCFKKFLPAVSSVFAQFIVLLPLFAVTAGVIAAYMYYLFAIFVQNPGNINLFLFITVIMVIFLLAVSILSSTAVIVALPVAIYENKYFFSAVKKGFMLIKKDFKKVLGTVAIFYLVTYIASYSLTAFSGVTKALIEMFLPRNLAAALSLSSLYLDYLLSAVLSVILSPLSGIFSAVIYINQKIKYEGFDIELKLNELKDKNLASKQNNPYGYKNLY